MDGENICLGGYPSVGKYSRIYILSFIIVKRYVWNDDLHNNNIDLEHEHEHSHPVSPAGGLPCVAQAFISVYMWKI